MQLCEILYAIVKELKAFLNLLRYTGTVTICTNLVKVVVSSVYIAFIQFS